MQTAAGALGIRMIDGAGHFLPESRRSFPSPLTSFFKLTGLATLFPRSPVFARYHMGHIDSMHTHDTDILSGAFMLLRQQALQITGGFDESFFMYGEDIDLSFRIRKAGYKNVYFAGSTIIHFKGESTKKGTLNYVHLFYKAMAIFVRKHYAGIRAGIVLFSIQSSIWLRAILTAVSGFIRNAGLPLADALLILASFWLAKYSWNTWFKPEISYPMQLLTIAFPLFTALFLIAAYYTGLYDKPRKKGQLIRSAAFALLVLLAFYSIAPERYRFSRAILLLGVAYAFIALKLSRLFLVRLKLIDPPEKSEKSQTIIAGTVSEFNRLSGLLNTTEREERILGRVAVTEDHQQYLVHIQDLQSFLNKAQVREIIFCENGLSFKEIIAITASLKGNLRIRISASGSHSIVGSDSRDEAGETFSIQDRYQIAKPVNKRLKRLTDVLVSILFLPFYPVGFFFLDKPFGALRNVFFVGSGRKTWVGYINPEGELPQLRKAVIGPDGNPVNNNSDYDESVVKKMNHSYAREYSVYNDISLIVKNYRRLGS